MQKLAHRPTDGRSLPRGEIFHPVPAAAAGRCSPTTGSGLPEQGRKRRFGTVWLGALLLLLWAILPLAAHAQIGFDPFVSKTGAFDLKIIGNGVHQLLNDPGQGDEDSFYDRGSTFGNNGRRFTYLDIDSDTTTFNSSTATYQIPPGETLVAAVLVWGGRAHDGFFRRTFDPDDLTRFGLPNGPMETATYDARDVKVSFDGGANYFDLTAQTFRTGTLSRNHVYTAAFDLTALAQGSLSGNLLSVTVANVLLRGPAVNDSPSVWSGWTVQLITAVPSGPFRRITVYEGLLTASGTSATTLLDGFTTSNAAAAGPFVTLMAGDGDLGGVDTFSFGVVGSPTPLGDALHATNDFANSRGTTGGQYFTDLPAFTRSPVRDRDVVDIVGVQVPTPILPPLSTEAELRVAPTSEGIIYHSIGVAFEALGLDWGDAPDSYGTDPTAGNSGADPVGASHTQPSLVYLGAVEGDADGPIVPSADAQSDDTSGDAPDDEDGVVGPINLVNGGDPYNFAVTVTGNGFLNAWVDWNTNGVFDSAELISDPDQPVTSGVVNLAGTVPATLVPGTSYARFRVCGTAGECNTPAGPADDGEVEDYRVFLTEVADLSVTKDLVTIGPYTRDQTVEFSITVTNNGPNDATNVLVTDTPSNLTITSVSSTNCVALPCTIPALANGASEVITVQATIDASGTFDNAVAVTVSSPVVDPVPENNTDDTGNGGSTSSADVSITKTLDTPGPYTLNQLVTYTLVVSNDGPSPATNVMVTDTPSNLDILSVSGSGCAALPCTIPTLGVGASTNISLTARITVAGGTFDNSATVSAQEHDPNLSNNTDASGNGGTTGRPVIGTAKQLTNLTDNGDGTWTATFDIAVENLGNEPLDNVQIVDDLADLPPGTTVDSLTSAMLTVNAGYAPGTDNNLLAGTDTLALGETRTVTLAITFTPDGNQPYNNQATGSGTGSQSGQTTSDPSDNGNDPDPNGNGDPNEAGENDPTPISPTITPVIGTAKELTGLTDNGNGTWTAAFSIAVTNLGNEPLVGVQIVEDLADLPPGTTVDSLTSAVMSVNPGYAPGTDNDLLTGTDVLAIGETKTLTLAITFTPDGNQPYTNQATGMGTGNQSGQGTTDPSDNGSDPDANGNGDPNEAGENDPTPIDPLITPVIATAKELTSLTDNGNGTWTAAFSIAVSNLGNEPLQDVQIVEDLADLPPGTTVDSLTSAMLAVNAGYAPGTDNDLLAGTDVLAIGETKTVTLVITFTPDGNQPYINQATGTATGMQSAQGTSDPSNNGSDPDPNGNGEPNESGENVPTPINPTITPVIGTAKQLSSLADNGNGTWTATFSIAVTNLGNEPLAGVQITEDLAVFPAGTTVDSLTSATLAVNAGYTPGTDDNLLTGTDTLAIGETRTVTLVITFTPDGNQPYINQATGAGTGAQSAQGTSDPSNNGSDPDPNGNGNPNESGENVPTAVNPTITPVIGTAKELSSLTDNGNGSWTATFSIAVTNLGNEPLQDVQIVEDLADLPPGTTVDSLTSAALTVNAGYAPGTDNNLLDGTDTLAIGETRTVILAITFTPDGNQPYINQAIGTATGNQSGQLTGDPSDNGSDPDADGDGNSNEPGENDPTPINPTVTPVIGTAKQLSTLTDNGNGSWTATFAIAVENLGNEALQGVQITDDLADLPPGTTVDSLTSATLTVNAGYAPGTDNDLLAGTDTLAIGETKAVTLVITFTPDGNQPYSNQATGAATGSQSGLGTNDLSDDGSDPDGNGNGNPNEPGENDPTPINPTVTPVIGTAKELSSLADNGNGTWTATFAIAVENLGNEALQDVQITEDLADLPPGTTVDSLTSATLTVNAGYTPGTDNDLLAGTDTLAIGETRTVTLVVTFTPDSNPPYTNQATGSATGSQSGQGTSDPSTNGNNPDPNGNGNPNEQGENEPTPITLTGATASIGTAKQLSDLTFNGDGSWTATFTIAVENLGNEPLVGVQIVDDLSDLPANTTVASLTSAMLTVNPGYAPGTDNNLLSGTDQLAIGETKTVTLVTVFRPDGNRQYTNQATGMGTGSHSGLQTSDPSNNGVDPDPNGNGNPNEQGENEPTAIDFRGSPVADVPLLGALPLVVYSLVLLLAGGAFLRRRRRPAAGR